MAKKKPFVLRLQPEILDALERWAGEPFHRVLDSLAWERNDKGSDIA